MPEKIAHFPQFVRRVANLGLFTDVVRQVYVLVIVLNRYLLNILRVVALRLIPLRLEVLPVQLWLGLQCTPVATSYVRLATDY